MVKFYTGIGSRETPEEMQAPMFNIARRLSEKGYTLRSGGADGADSFFEMGAKKKEIYLPWKNFNNNPSPLFELSDEAFEIAEQFHPAWEKLSKGARNLHARNTYQVLGKDLHTPSDFIICWSKGTGGTEQSLRIARHYNIPIYNLYEMSLEEVIEKIG